MDTEKRITFTGEDRGVVSTIEKIAAAERERHQQAVDHSRTELDSSREQTSVFDRLRSEATRYYSEMLTSAKKETDVFREQVAIINEKIRAQKAENDIFERQFRSEAREQYEKEMASATTPAQEKRAEMRFQEAMLDIQSRSREENDTIALLRQLLEETKGQRKTTERASQEAEERWDAQKSLWTQEFREDTEGVRQRVSKLASGELPSDTSEAVREKLRYQQYLIEEADKGKPAPEQRSILRDLINSALLQQTFQAVKQTIMSVSSARDENALEPGLFGSAIRLGGYGVAGITQLSGKALLAAGGKVGAKAAADVAGLESVVSTITQAEIATADIVAGVVESSVQRHFAAKREKDIARLALFAVTGKQAFSAIDFGLTTAQAAEIARTVATTSGTSADLGRRTNEMLGLEFGFGINRGSLTQMMSIGRMTGIEGSAMTANLIQTLKDKGVIRGNDFSRLEENIQILSSYLSMQGNVVNAPNANVANGIVAAFRQLGGPFADQRLASLLPQFGQSLATPGNEFDQARNFAVLSKIRGGQGSYFDFLKDQSRGLSTEGFFGETLKQIERESGGGVQNTALGIMSRFNFLSPEQAELLATMFMSDRSRFDKFAGSETDIQNLLAGRPKVTSTVRSQAEIEEAYAESGLEGFKTALRLNLTKFKNQVSQDILDAILESLGDNSKKLKAQAQNNLPLSQETKNDLGLSESGYHYATMGDK